MSIPARKADSLNVPYVIRLKRTTLDNTNTKLNDQGTLEYGEPLYNDKEKTLQLGTNSLTKNQVKDLPILKFRDRNTVDREVFFKDKQENNMMTLEDENGNMIYEKTKFWTFPDSKGVTKDSAGNVVQVNYSNQWYHIDSNGYIDKTNPVKNKSTEPFPWAQEIPVTGITEDDIVQVSLALSNAERVDITKTKNAEKVFGTIYCVDSYDGGIIIYIKKFRDGLNCYLNIFGG